MNYLVSCILACTTFISTSCINARFEQTFNHASKLLKARNHCAALPLWEQLLRNNPDCFTTRYNCAFTYKECGLMDKALPLYQDLIALQPTHTHAHIGYAQALLASGNLCDGFKELEWRFGSPRSDTPMYKEYLKRHHDLTGKIILLRAEWGIGDTLWLVRYAQLLHERGAIVNLALLHGCLVPLLSRCPYLHTLIAPGQPAPPFHIEIPLISLPYVFDTTLETIPQNIPYLTAHDDLIKKWRTFLPKERFNVGICWHGNTIHRANKFIPLEKLLKLSSIANVQLFCLQQQHGLDQLNKVNQDHIITFEASFDRDNGAFEDTAALMMLLDLVITVDTSIAHLAGALGVPTWVILPHVADWRWMQKTFESAWYPKMRLYRQQHTGNWDTIIDQIFVDISALVEKQRPS